MKGMKLTSAHEVQPAAPTDKRWILDLFKLYGASIGDEFVAWREWQSYWTAIRRGRASNERWLVIRPYGFVHYRKRRDGMHVIHEVAVTKEAQGKGIGRQLVESVPRPVKLLTDADNIPSNALYRKLGFVLVGRKTARSGKLINIYQAW